MNNELCAYIDGKKVGTFVENNGQITFSYVDNPSQHISLSMPASRRTHKNKSSLCYLWGLLPDNQQALANMAREAGTSANSIFGILKHHGQDVAGALQLLPPEVTPADANKRSLFEVSQRLSDSDLEVLLKQSMDRYHGQQALDASSTEAFKFSIAGAQPKIALTADRQGNFLPPSKDFATTHIIKPNDPQSAFYFSDIDIIEVACLKAAETLGITSSQSFLWESPSGDLKALITRRYDRVVNEDGTISRLHQEDFCQALSVMPEKKYQHRDGGPGISDMGRLIRNSVSPAEREPILQSLFAALIFNIGILGTDAHAKNYSLLYNAGTALAPLYDSISAAAHISGDSTAHFPMKVGNTYSFTDISTKDLVSVGQKLSLPAEYSEQKAREILTGIPQALLDATTNLGHPKIGEQFVDGILQLSPVRWYVSS